MKKSVCVILLVVFIAICLTGCGRFKCDICTRYRSGEQHEVGAFIYCDDCYETYQKALDTIFNK